MGVGGWGGIQEQRFERGKLKEVKSQTKSKRGGLALVWLAALADGISGMRPLTEAQEAEAASGRIVREGGDCVEEIAGVLLGARNLRVRADMGKVMVRGGGGQEVRYVIHARTRCSSEEEARKRFAVYKLSVSLQGDTAVIERGWKGVHMGWKGGGLTVGEWKGGKAKISSADFTINVPNSLELTRIETEGGGVDVAGIAGRVEVTTGGGNIRLENIGGPANVETGGGAITLATIGGDATCHTGGGLIVVRSVKGKIVAESGGGSIEIVGGQQEVSAETGGGNISVRQCSGKVKAQTGGGTAELGDIGGPAEISTGGGSIRLTSVKGPVKAETGSGNIELYGVSSVRAETGSGGIIVKLVNTGAPRVNSYLETPAGDITVYVAADVGVTIRASIDVANGHGIHSDFPELQVHSEGGQYGPQTFTAEGSVNGGGPVLKLATTTGDINIRRAGK